jgi:hypothetical protein
VSASQEAEGLSLGLFRSEHSVVITNGVDFEEMDALLHESAITRAAASR